MSDLARQRAVLRPSQLNALARDLLEGQFPQVWVEGEISNWSRPASGHAYFALKDERAQVRCAMFKPRLQVLRFLPRDGMKVLARGRLSLYEPRGDYQLILDHLEDAGEGALRRAYEELKARLAGEGLFAVENKLPLPKLPRRLGVLTSATGAAVHDVLSVLGRRFPALEVEVWPVPVQGATAAAEILRMLRAADASGRYDVLLLTRGGGSLEDLWPFNDEALVRAVAACVTPVVSAIGHEVDVSLTDFAADVRAATPSAAAELLVPDRQELLARLRADARRLDTCWQRQRQRLTQRLDQAQLRLAAAAPGARLQRGQQRLQELQRRLQQQMQQRLQLRRQTLQAVARHLQAVSPLATLARGYAIVQTEDGRVVVDADALRSGEELSARFARGRRRLRVLD